MKFSTSLLICVIFCTGLHAQMAPTLGAAQSFAVLGSATITNTGPTIITGNVGVSPGSAVTGFPPGLIVNGQIFSGAASDAGAAQTAAIATYNDLASRESSAANLLTGKVLGETAGAITLTPGVYKFSSSAQLNSTLTLDDGGDPNAVFIFQIGSTLTTASYSKVVMKSGGKGANVYWQIGSSATIGTYTTFLGNIIATASITMTTGATTTGRLFALHGATTMDTNNAFAVAIQVLDADGDGIPDSLDDYPNDPTKAFNNYSSPGTGSTTAFEDEWPLRGDFDMNDLIMVSKYNVITNSQNAVVQVIGSYTLVAAGTIYADAFGVEFPIPAGNVINVTGAKLEAGQAKAVIVLFDDVHTELSAWNTVPGAVTSPPKNYTVTFDVLNGPQFSDFGTDYNPFIFNYHGTSRSEVHTVGKTPTSLADLSLFGTKDDNSNVAAGRYYVTKTGLPFSITIPTATFAYPIEFGDISKEYSNFGNWAESGGLNSSDWFSNTGPGYRDPAFMYVAPVKVN